MQVRPGATSARPMRGRYRLERAVSEVLVSTIDVVRFDSRGGPSVQAPRVLPGVRVRRLAMAVMLQRGR